MGHFLDSEPLHTKMHGEIESRKQADVEIRINTHNDATQLELRSNDGRHVKLLICLDPVPGLPKVRTTSKDGLILHEASR
jgi:hypothetical protein